MWQSPFILWVSVVPCADKPAATLIWEVEDASQCLQSSSRADSALYETWARFKGEEVCQTLVRLLGRQHWQGLQKRCPLESGSRACISQGQGQRVEMWFWPGQQEWFLALDSCIDSHVDIWDCTILWEVSSPTSAAVSWAWGLLQDVEHHWQCVGHHHRGGFWGQNPWYLCPSAKGSIPKGVGISLLTLLSSPLWLCAKVSPWPGQAGSSQLPSRRLGWRAWGSSGALLCLWLLWGHECESGKEQFIDENGAQELLGREQSRPVWQSRAQIQGQLNLKLLSSFLKLFQISPMSWLQFLLFLFTAWTTAYVKSDLTATCCI